MAKIIELILTEAARGIGTREDPFRLCPQLFNKDGGLVADFDPMPRDHHETPLVIFNPENLPR